MRGAVGAALGLAAHDLAAGDLGTGAQPEPGSEIKGNYMTKWRKQTADEVFSIEDVTARLGEELPNWYFEDGWIRRKFKTSGWKSTMMVVNTIGHLSEAAWHHPDLTVSYAFVTVKLMNHAANGITEKDFQLAAKIEEVVMWQPGILEGTALEGTPDDPRFKYIKYE